MTAIDESCEFSTKSAALAIYHRLIKGFYLKSAQKYHLDSPQVGAVSVIQRFGGALNLNVHFHSLYMDGVYFKNESGVLIFREIIPTDEDILEIVSKAHRRINRLFQKNGFFDNVSSEEKTVDELIEKDGQLSLIKAESVNNRVEGVKRPREIGKYEEVPFEQFLGKKCANAGGFSLHANVKIKRGQRSKLEKLCRYVSRGALAKERVSLHDNENVRLQLKTAYKNGTTHLEFTPAQFIRRMIALIPPPRQNFIRYLGVFGPRHRDRAEITSKACPTKDKTRKKKVYRTPWAELLKRVFKYEVIYCERCNGKLELISTITSPLVAKKILDHLGINSVLIEVAGARGPPEWDENPYNDGHDYNQEHSW